MGHTYVDNPQQETEARSGDGNSHLGIRYRAVPGCHANWPVLRGAFCHESMGAQRDAQRDLQGNTRNYGTVPQRATLSTHTQL